MCADTECKTLGTTWFDEELFQDCEELLMPEA